METVVRYVRDIASTQRSWLESEIGHQLQDDQRVVIQVFALGDAPSAANRQRAFDEFRDLSQQGARHRESLGVSELEADAVLDEAVRQIRSSQAG